MAKTVGKPRVRKSLADLEPPPRTKRPESLTSREQEILAAILAREAEIEVVFSTRVAQEREQAEQEAEERLAEEWAKLDVGYIRSLYESLPRREAALKKAKGGHIKY